MKSLFRVLPLLALAATSVACSDGKSPTDSGSRLSVAVESHSLSRMSGTDEVVVPVVAVTIKNTGTATVGGLLIGVSFMKGSTAVGQAHGAFTNPLSSGESARIEAPFANIPSYDCYRLSVQGYEQGASRMQTLLESKGNCQ